MSHEPSASAPRPIAIALAGLVALAVAMGIGRFAFTPLLPMMLHDGVVDLGGASWLATANYLGYWLGAMACALQPTMWRRWGLRRPLRHTAVVRAGLVATVLLTLGMALPGAALWPLWRGLAGVASALVFVYVSGWCLARLSALGAPALAGIIYVGPGLGITVSGLAATAMVAGGLSAAVGWAVFALLAAALAVAGRPAEICGEFVGLRHWDGDTYVYEPAGESANPGSVSKLTFARGRGGRASAMTIEYYQQDGMGTFTRRA